jgi:hypothetical protein
VGRLSKYNDLIADALCEEMIKGRSVLQICNDADFPSENTVYRWLDQHPSFREKYARARELQADHYAAEIVALADTPIKARKIVIKADGSEETTIGDAVERTRLQIDARKWYSSKLAPKKYGEKVEQFVSGPEGGPLESSITINLVKPTNAGS